MNVRRLTKDEKTVIEYCRVCGFKYIVRGNDSFGKEILTAHKNKPAWSNAGKTWLPCYHASERDPFVKLACVYLFDFIPARRNGIYEIPKIQLNDEERKVIHECIVSGCNYLARDGDGMLYAHNEEPYWIDEDQEWYSGRDNEVFWLNHDELFKFIKPDETGLYKIPEEESI